MIGAPKKVQRVVIVTGPSGAGRSTAINVLEDFGYEVIDNLPLSLIPRLLSGPTLETPLALGVDVRNRDFSPAAMLDLVDQLAEDETLQVDLLYLDCSREVLVRRFSETRRRHPMAPTKAPADGITLETELLIPVRVRADVLIDTSHLTPHELRDEVKRLLFTKGSEGLAISVQSFSYKRGLPRGLDLVFDARFLRNPHWNPDLRPLDGRDASVADYVAEDARYDAFLNKVLDMTTFLLPAFEEEGKSHLAIGIGCSGGRHRSVAIAEKLANELANTGWQVSIRHRELTRSAGAGGS